MANAAIGASYQFMRKGYFAWIMAIMVENLCLTEP